MSLPLGAGAPAILPKEKRVTVKGEGVEKQFHAVALTIGWCNRKDHTEQLGTKRSVKTGNDKVKRVQMSSRGYHARKQAQRENEIGAA